MSEDLTKQSLLSLTQEIEKMSDTIVRAAEGRRPMPTTSSEALKKVGDLTTECEEALAEYLDGTLSKETLETVVAALSAIHAGIDSLIVFSALEGSAYSTTTVAND